MKKTLILAVAFLLPSFAMGAVVAEKHYRGVSYVKSDFIEVPTGKPYKATVSVLGTDGRECATASLSAIRTADGVVAGPCTPIDSSEVFVPERSKFRYYAANAVYCMDGSNGVGAKFDADFYIETIASSSATITINGPAQNIEVTPGAVLSVVSNGTGLYGTHEPWYSYGIQNPYPAIGGNGATPSTIIAKYDGYICWNMTSGGVCHTVKVVH